MKKAGTLLLILFASCKGQLSVSPKEEIDLQCDSYSAHYTDTVKHLIPAKNYLDSDAHTSFIYQDSILRKINVRMIGNANFAMDSYFLQNDSLIKVENYRYIFSKATHFNSIYSLDTQSIKNYNGLDSFHWEKFYYQNDSLFFFQNNESTDSLEQHEIDFFKRQAKWYINYFYSDLIELKK